MLVVGPFIISAFLQVLWTFGILVYFVSIVQLITTIRWRWRDISIEYLVEMGFVSVVGSIPATQGFISHAIVDAVKGLFFSAILWIAGYVFVTKMMDGIEEDIKKLSETLTLARFLPD